MIRIDNYYVLSEGFEKDDRIIYEGIQGIKNGEFVEIKLVNNPMNNNNK